jgi:enamine deaminase RidA (YjgF/YER057c/UK114 family)
MSGIDILQPKSWTAPQGYANGMAAQGRVVFVAGQIGWNERAELVSREFGPQVEQALRNIVAVLAEAGGAPHHLTRMNWYITDRAAYVAQRRAIGEAYRRVIGRHFPAMTLVVVAGLLEEGALVEIEATGVVPSLALSPSS